MFKSIKTCFRLRTILKTKKAEVITGFSTQTSPISKEHISMRELAEEPNLEILADKLKRAAKESSTFRNRHNIYHYSISRLAIAKRFNLIEEILECHKYFNEITREGYALHLISLYGKAGMFDHARKLFDELPELNCQRTIKSFNALLKAGVDSKRFDEVFRLFKESPRKLSMSCDFVTYNTVIHAYCETGKLDEGLLMVDEMKAMGVSPSEVTFITLLGAFYREKGLNGGEIIWGMMDQHNVMHTTSSYNLKMQALVKEGETTKAFGLFEKLVSEGLKPNVTTFNVFIKVGCDHGDVEEAKKWYKALVDSGATPNSYTFSTLVPKLCDSGDFGLAFELSKKMFSRQFKRQFVVDEALLQLIVNKLVEGSMIEEAKELVELGKSNTYVQYNLVLPSYD